MMKVLARSALAGVAAVVLSMTAVSCSGGSQTATSNQPQMMMYECPCGVKKSEVAGKPVPICCGKPMMVKK